MMYCIGIDGCGNYSRLVAADMDMNIIGRHAGASVNIKTVGYNAAKINMKKLIHEFNRLTNTSAGDCVSLCIVRPGIDAYDEEGDMQKLLLELGLTCLQKTANEAEALLATETKGSEGVLVVSAAGSYGYAVDKIGNPHRCGGYGPLADDAGSGYWIGMQAVRQAVLSLDGRAPKTLLADKIKEQMGLKQIKDIVNYVNSDRFNKSAIAELAFAVKYAAIQKDPLARRIETDAAKELYLIAKALMQRLELYDGLIVLAGNVLISNESIRKQTEGMITKEFTAARVITLNQKPETGALHLAERLYSSSILSQL